MDPKKSLKDEESNKYRLSLSPYPPAPEIIQRIINLFRLLFSSTVAVIVTSVVLLIVLIILSIIGNI